MRIGATELKDQAMAFSRGSDSLHDRMEAAGINTDKDADGFPEEESIYAFGERVAHNSVRASIEVNGTPNGPEDTVELFRQAIVSSFLIGVDIGLAIPSIREAAE